MLITNYGKFFKIPASKVENIQFINDVKATFLFFASLVTAKLAPVK